MKKFLIIFALLFIINGWATSRFSVFINGVKSGEIEISRDFKGDTVITKSKQKLVLKRGSSTLTTINLTKSVETKSGIPIEYEYKMEKGSTSLVPNITIRFLKDYAEITTPLGKQKLSININKVKQDYGEELLFKSMIETNTQSAEIMVFNPDIINFDTVKVKYAGKTQEGYKFILQSQVLGIEEERIVNQKGETIKSKTNIGGIDITILKEGVEKGRQEKIKGAEILTPSFIKIDYFVPRGITVSAIAYKLQNKEDYDFTIIEYENQKVKVIDKKSCILTVKRSKIPLNATPDKDEKYLKSSPIINLNNEKLVAIVNKLKKESKNTYDFVRNTVNFVFNYIKNKNFDNAFANTDTILKEKKGDCTEHSFLATAIFRKAGIPARCVIGIVMGDNAFGYHMWCEVKLNGKWYGVDPTLNQLNPDPTHIRIDDFEVSVSTIKNVYKVILPLIKSLSIKPLKITFSNGKSIENPEKFFEELFNAHKWGFNYHNYSFTLSAEREFFRETVYLNSLFIKDKNLILRHLNIFNNYETSSIQDIKGLKVIFFIDKNRAAFSFVYNSVMVSVEFNFKKPIGKKELREIVYKRAVEVIGKCQKRF